MLLITGGAYQGKLGYALNLMNIKEETMIDGANCSEKELLEKPLVNHFHLWIKRMLIEKKDMEDIKEVISRIAEQNKDLVIIVDELGCGVVPIDSFDRLYRETTGRVCCEIAKKSIEVHRVICGIGTVIKHA